MTFDEAIQNLVKVSMECRAGWAPVRPLPGRLDLSPGGDPVHHYHDGSPVKDCRQIREAIVAVKEATVEVVRASVDKVMSLK